MLEIAADSEALGEHVQSALGGTSVLIAEADLCVHPVTNGLDPRPSRSRGTKQLQGNHREPVDLAVAAIVKIAQPIVGQFLRRNFPPRQAHRISNAGIVNHRRIAQTQHTSLRHKAGAAISETIDETLYGSLGR